MLRRNFLLNDAFLDEILVGGVAEGDDAASEPVGVVLRLQLHLLLLVHLYRVEAVLVEVRGFVRDLLL